MNSLAFRVAYNSDLAVKNYESNLLVRIKLFNLTEVRFDRTKNALLPWDVGFILVVGSREIMQLCLISRLHELPKHLYFFLAYPIFKLDLAHNFSGWIHTAWGVNAEDEGWVILSNFFIVRTLYHVDYVVLWRHFFFLNLENIAKIAKLAFPICLIFIELYLFDQMNGVDCILPVNFRVFIENGLALLAFIGISSWELLLGCLYALESYNKHI